MGRLEQAKTGAELVKVVLDIVFAVFDRAKARRDAEQAARLRELEAENAALRAAQHL